MNSRRTVLMSMVALTVASLLGARQAAATKMTWDGADLLDEGFPLVKRGETVTVTLHFAINEDLERLEIQFPSDDDIEVLSSSTVVFTKVKEGTTRSVRVTVRLKAQEANLGVFMLGKSADPEKQHGPRSQATSIGFGRAPSPPPAASAPAPLQLPLPPTSPAPAPSPSIAPPPLSAAARAPAPSAAPPPAPARGGCSR